MTSQTSSADSYVGHVELYFLFLVSPFPIKDGLKDGGWRWEEGIAWGRDAKGWKTQGTNVLRGKRT